MVVDLTKKFLAAFLLLAFGQALEVRLDALDSTLGKSIDLEWLLELDETTELEQHAPVFDESDGLDTVEDKLQVSSSWAGLSSAKPHRALFDVHGPEISHWLNAAAEAGSKIPLYLLYHHLKGY